MIRANTPAPKPLTCPTCSKKFYASESEAMPFCCRRCQLIDLGKWLDEKQGLPYEGNPGDAPEYDE